MTSSETEFPRRELLTASLATTTWALTTELSAMSAPEPGLPRVGVIGAGFGGLACAYELSDAGYLVDVFEARNRIGGRVRSEAEFAPGQVVEFGAELIGKNHSNWIRYAKKFGIKLTPVDDGGNSVREVLVNGKRYLGDNARDLERELEPGYEALNSDAKQANSQEPWKTPDAERYDQMSVADRLSKMTLTDRARLTLARELELDMAVPLSKMNYLALMCTIHAHGVEKFWTDTEVYRAEHGNQTLASYLAGGIRGTVHLDCQVTSVVSKDREMQIRLQDGRSFTYQDVVLAVPPSVWSRIEFSPALPAALNPQMGTATKLLTVCRDGFWEPDRSPDSLTDTLVGSTWEGAPEPGGKRRTLVAFAGGSPAEAIHDLGFGKQKEAVAAAIEAWLPGFQQAQLKSELVDWPGDPWVRGGYSFPRPGEFLSHIRLMREGIGRLHFAGEHASSGFIGYMEGGLDSGVSVANRMIQRDKNR